MAFVFVRLTIDSLEALRARAKEGAGNGVGLTKRASMTRIGLACVFQVAKKPGLPGRTFAVVRPQSIVTGGAVVTRLSLAIVNVDGTIVASVSILAKTSVTTNSIGACGAVLADCRTDFALVDVLVAESAGEIWRTLTLVRVDAINASPAVLTQMTVAVVDVYLTTVASKSGRTVTSMSCLTQHHALAFILARRGLTRDVTRSAILSSPPLLTLALVRAASVVTSSAVSAGRLLFTFVDIVGTRRSFESGRAFALVGVRFHDAGGTFADARVRGTMVCQIASRSVITNRTIACKVFRCSNETASASIMTRAAVASVSHVDLAKACRESERTVAFEVRHGFVNCDLTCAAVSARILVCAWVFQLTVFPDVILSANTVALRIRIDAFRSVHARIGRA